jgi:predicted amidophosphoribosyltransferase
MKKEGIKLIFRNGMQQPSDGKIFSFLDYVPVRYNIDDGGTSRRILDYKNKAEYMLRDYAKHLNGILGEDFAIAVMPSSSVENNYNSASHDTAGRLIRMACFEGRVIYDATRCLTRVKSITPQHRTPGLRSEQIHLDTIKVYNPEAVAGRNVVVLDDIVTSGASLRAVSQLLRAAGATMVVCIALGRTLTLSQVISKYGSCA